MRQLGEFAAAAPAIAGLTAVGAAVRAGGASSPWPYSGGAPLAFSGDVRKVTSPGRPQIERVGSRTSACFVAMRNQVVRETRAA